MNIIIRPTEVADAKGISELYSQPKAQRETLQLPLPSTALWQERLSNIPQGLYSYVAELDGKIVGNIGFEHSQRPRTAHCASFGIGVHDEYHGMGIGSQLIETILELADNWLNVLRIQIEVTVDNKAAIALYSKYGFEIEGEAQYSVYRDGDYVSTYYMARIKN
ncbi:GNAT family N-acetyltransferase [Vibrio hippocampi]|uniref:L-amino acid N-acetyltransferase AaaT n=1 Tax=Vibrio hippocampi TaxID=654686 RepID=A0ABN8DNG7_9VIBR|nr:GNAT family N-acetyltransferase [Vibrio hippocampi]CAH0528886.1 L-amino acid N-acetyltransferase AaaT [Vibrio hippocampi]